MRVTPTASSSCLGIESLAGHRLLVVTHDLQLAKRMSRQLEMRDGRLTAELSLMGAGNGDAFIVINWPAF